MIEIESALARLYEKVSFQHKTEMIPIAKAVGRVSAHSLRAKVAVPSFPRAGMDGYAIVAADTFEVTATQPLRLKVIGTLYAGDHRPELKGRSGTAVRIMTGAPIPEGFDGVVQQEWTDQGQREVVVFRSCQVGCNYGEVGEDVTVDQLLISRHQLLNSRAVGVLAAEGLTSIRVLRPMRIGLIVTGSELVPPGVPLRPGQIYNSNLATLRAFIEASGSQVVVARQCPDGIDELADMIDQAAAEVDVLITTGGVSVGQRDYVPAAIEQLNGDVLFHHVKMQPGTPIMASRYRHCLILSFSGQPFAAMVSLHLFYWPLLAHVMQCPALGVATRLVQVNDELVASHKRRFRRGWEADGWVSLGPGPHYSSVFHNSLATNCFVEQPAEVPLKKGDYVKVYYWQD